MYILDYYQFQYKVKMQHPEIAKGIKFMNEHKLADVMILARGGGSLEDLWPFNEEVVANAIYESDIPIISAVGHETDFSISDFTADLWVQRHLRQQNWLYQMYMKFHKK